jgi:hypothetical protein
MLHVWETDEVHKRFSRGDLDERGHSEYLGLDERIILK